MSPLHRPVSRCGIDVEEDGHVGGVVGGWGGEVACVERHAGEDVVVHLDRCSIREGVADAPAEADSARRRGTVDVSIDPCVLLQGSDGPWVPIEQAELKVPQDEHEHVAPG